MGDRAIKGSWLEAYLAYTAESQSPEEYHLWTAISVIAGAIRRKAFFNMGYFLLYPNMYIVLVGPPGRCKKSTAMRMGKTLLEPVPGIEFTSDSTTRERLIQDLSQAYKDGQSALTAHSTEFASLLTSSGMDMVVFLTDIFDCPTTWSHKTKAGGTNTIKAPFLNMLGATTPDWLSKSMPLDTIGIGLTSRVVFVFQDTPRIKHWRPQLSEQQKMLAHLLTTDLIAISTISGEYRLEPDADSMYSQWDIDHQRNPNPSGDARLGGYYERKPMHLLKLSMIVAASKRNETIITVEDMQQALALFAKIEERMPKAFAGVGRNPINADRQDIYDTIVFTGGMTMGQLLEKYSYSLRKDELAEAVDTLMMIGKIALIGNVYKPVP